MQTREELAPRAPIDATTAIAIACIVAGWFWLNMFVTQVGRLELDFHFYDMWALISRPALLITGIRNDHSAKSIAFGLLCGAVAMAPLAPYFWKTKHSWLGSFAPLALMLVCGAILYAQTSSGYFQASPGTGAIGRDFVDLANEVANRVSGTIAKRVAVGGGAYVSLAASIFLAVKGWRRFRGENRDASLSTI